MTNPELAFIMRSDEMIREFGMERMTVETSRGSVDRCFVGEVFGVPVAILYGRFGDRKTPSNMIDFSQNVEAVVRLGARKLVGTFVVGGISPARSAGSVYVLGDLVGMGGYRVPLDAAEDFHNAEMYRPFCRELTARLERAARTVCPQVVTNATYVCFHGWPRIETAAELAFYDKMGWDVVGQTCDPEATIARLHGLCYAGIAVQIDEPRLRSSAAEGGSVRLAADNSLTIRDCRKRTTAVVLQMIRDYSPFSCQQCLRGKRTNRSFRKLPDWYYD